MLYACDQRFDVTENLENFCELNKANKALVFIHTVRRLWNAEGVVLGQARTHLGCGIEVLDGWKMIKQRSRFSIGPVRYTLGAFDIQTEQSQPWPRHHGTSLLFDCI